MLIKTLLNKVERFKSFIYGNSKLMTVGGNEALVIDIKPRQNSKPECSECGKRAKPMTRSRFGFSSMFRSGHSRSIFVMLPVGFVVLDTALRWKPCLGRMARSR